MPPDSVVPVEISDPEHLVKDPLVSVLIATYNQESFLAQAINGVIEQCTSFSIELIIGDDCSVDLTREIALEYQLRYPAIIRILTYDVNVGPHKNFLSIYRAARGKYLALCDGDDFWCDSGKLQNQVEILERDQECTGVFHDCYRLNEKTGEKLKRIGGRCIDFKPNFESVIREKNIATASMLFRKISFDESENTKMLTVTQGDYMLALLVAKRGYWFYIPKVMSVYRIHDGGIWSSQTASNIVKNDIDFYETIMKDSQYSMARPVIYEKRRDAIRRLAIIRVSKGVLLASFLDFLSTIGPKKTQSVHCVDSFVYWKALLRQYIRIIGFEKPYVAIKRLIRSCCG